MDIIHTFMLHVLYHLNHVIGSKIPDLLSGRSLSIFPNHKTALIELYFSKIVSTRQTEWL